MKHSIFQLLESDDSDRLGGHIPHYKGLLTEITSDTIAGRGLDRARTDNNRLYKRVLAFQQAVEIVTDRVLPAEEDIYEEIAPTISKYSLLADEFRNYCLLHDLTRKRKHGEMQQVKIQNDIKKRGKLMDELATLKGDLYFIWPDDMKTAPTDFSLITERIKKIKSSIENLEELIDQS